MSAGEHDRAMDVTPTRPGPDAHDSGEGPEVPRHRGADPLRLCVVATVALTTWLAGPGAVVFFAGLGIVGYARARRAGLLRSRCLLGDTRLVLLYLAAVLALAGWALWRQVSG